MVRQKEMVMVRTHTAKTLICLTTGKVWKDGMEPWPGMMLMPVEEAEPHYEQHIKSAAIPQERTDDGKFDKSHLSPENAWRIGRDYFAHAMRYGWPMHLVREYIGPGGRFLEMGCGKELPLFRTLTMDLSAVKYYKPALYVAADLNEFRYRPAINGCRTVLLPNTNIVESDERVPDEPFDLVISFEVLEHMPKEQGEKFLDAMVGYASRKPQREKKPGLIALSTPVNGGNIAKNHIYEWQRSELRRAWEKRGCRVRAEYGTFSNLRDIVDALTEAETEVWNSMAAYYSPHVLSCLFSATHPEVARNIAWEVEVT